MSQSGEDGTELAAAIEDYWSDERCAWRVEFEASLATENAGWWNVWLEWTQERDNPHQADWATYTWQFYADNFTEAMSEAVAWLRALAPWRPCPECDGRGAWGGEPCPDCDATGFANKGQFGGSGL